jgi:putative glutamine amidotransferase
MAGESTPQEVTYRASWATTTRAMNIAVPADPAESESGEMAVIGISCDIEMALWGTWSRRAALVPAAYVEAVVNSGGRPVLLPPMAEGAAETVAAIDGLILAGGADIEPERYGEQPHPRTRIIRPHRDAGELALLAEAENRGLPVLGICRGVELITVARGAPLHQHLPDRAVDGDPRAEYEVVHQGAPGQYVNHDVTIAEGSKLASIVGTKLTVSSYHHQAPARPGRGMVAVAHAPDGTLEAVEDPDKEFHLGVLWHPEFDGQLGLFYALVAAARAYRRSRAVPSRRARVTPE